MTSRSRWLLLGFAVVGLVCASASTYVHYRLLTDPTYVSPCDLNTTFNCTQVYLSRFGSIRGIPVALGGVLWFALVALIVGFSRPSRARLRDPADPTAGYVFALATVGLAAVLYLGYVSFFLLKTGCLLCMGTYVCVIGIFVVSGLTTSVAMTRLPLRLFGDLRALPTRPVALLIAILLFAGAGSAVAFFPKEARIQTAPVAAPAKDAKKSFEDAWAAQPRVDLGIPANGAKVVIVKFNDWLCPACKGAQLAYQPILDKYAATAPGSVKYVVKDWPWNNTCNFNITVTISGHQGSCAAAAAVRMAADRGKHDEMVAWIFDNQEKLVEMGMRGVGAPEAVKAQAVQLLGLSDFDHDYALKLPDIRRDVADGGVLQVHSTPTFYVNGVHANGPNGETLPPEYFDLAIQYELTKSASASPARANPAGSTSSGSR